MKIHLERELVIHPNTTYEYIAVGRVIWAEYRLRGAPPVPAWEVVYDLRAEIPGSEPILGVCEGDGTPGAPWNDMRVFWRGRLWSTYVPLDRSVGSPFAPYFEFAGSPIVEHGTLITGGTIHQVSCEETRENYWSPTCPVTSY